MVVNELFEDVENGILDRVEAITNPTVLIRLNEKLAMETLN
jgi:hypothetical protein